MLVWRWLPSTTVLHSQVLDPEYESLLGSSEMVST